MEKKKHIVIHNGKEFTKYEVPGFAKFGKQQNTTFWAKDSNDAADYLRHIKQLNKKEK